MKTVALHTMGCRLNMAETGSLAEGFKDRGYSFVDFGEEADVTFINTCTVTDDADSSCRNLIRKAQRNSPEGTLVVAGCYAQMNPDSLQNMKGVDLVLGNSEKYKVFEYLENVEEQIVKVEQTNEFWAGSTAMGDHHTRAFMKIQDGCNYICSFCIIPFSRGRSRAISIAEGIEVAQRIISQGYKEIVLTGVNIGEYESSSGEKLEDLVREILSLEGLERLRLSSVEPNTLTNELLEVLANSPKTMNHFHIPCQSGDDTVLKSMRRKYTSGEYEKTLKRVRNYFPDCAIGADLIVGHPGETEEQFEKTMQFVQDVGLTHFHVFPYSKRKGVLSSRLPDQIPHHVKKQRVKRLIELGKKQKNNFMFNSLGKSFPVLFERKNKSGHWEGHTPHYLKVEVSSELNLKNKIVDTKISGILGESLKGTHSSSFYDKEFLPGSVRKQ